MLSRCKGKTPAKYTGCIAMPAAQSSLSRIRRQESSLCNDVLETIPAGRQTFARQQRLTASNSDSFLLRNFVQSRHYSTDVKEGESANGKPSPSGPGSLFNSQESAWDHVFHGIDELPPLASMPVQARPRSTVGSPAVATSRRQAMTAREIEIFNSMFGMIFDAAMKQQQKAAAPKIGPLGGRPRTAADRRADKAARRDPLTGVGIGSTPDGTSAMSDLFGKLRRVSRKFRWSLQEDADLERKMQQMELCDSDQQLLEWAAKEVFDESARYEEAARQAVLLQETNSSPANTEPAQPKSESEPSEAKSTSPETQASPASESESDLSSRPAVTSPLPLQPPSYPHLLAALIRSFRDKFHDPNLALSIFEHARSRSIASYVFGCTVPAYNELIRTRWEAFRDLRGVADALNEMRVNGIAPNGQTRTFVEELRRDVGARTVWQEERNIGTGEVLELLNQIEMLSKEPLKKDAEERRKNMNNRQKKRGSKTWRSSDEEWKLDYGKPDRNYKFGNWTFPNPRPKRNFKPRTSDRHHQRHSAPSSRADKLAFE